MNVPTGPQGVTGPAGPVARTSTIIPFASGEAGFLTSSMAGQRSSVATIGFGNTYQIIAPNDPLNLPINTGAEQKQLAFSMPCNGVITDMTVYFSLVSAGTLGINDIITAQRFYSSAPNNSFMSLADAKVVFSQIAGGASIGTIRYGTTTGLSIPVTIGTRLLMAFYNTTVNNVTSSLSGFMSGGVRIEL